MEIRHVAIHNFRGIQSLDWTVPAGFTCLIGPGDATKTTVLDAIELALFPRWAVALDDADFYRADTTSPFVVDVTVGGLPDHLKQETRFGMSLRGWSSGAFDDSPDSSESVLTIRFTADDSLEPKWYVINGQDVEGRPIGHRDRELLGAVRFGAGTDRQFTWGTGTLLTRLADRPDATHELARAARAARSGTDLSTIEALQTAITKVTETAKSVGVVFQAPAALLDPAAVSLRTGAIALHQNEVPFRRSGLGSRMLVLLAMQKELARTGGMGLVDEIEQGLEPHRLRAVLRALKADGGQILATSHSPIAVSELGPANVAIVRSTTGTTTVTPVSEKLRPFVLRSAEMLLARKILVCEGKTELGFCRFLDEHWDGVGTTLASGGVCLCDGQGSEASKIAAEFAKLGYAVTLLGDDDCPTTPDDAALRALGVTVHRWTEGRAFEDQLFKDVSWMSLVKLVQYAVEQHGEIAIRAALGAALEGTDVSTIPWPCESWDEQDPRWRVAVPKAAKRDVSRSLRGWFKRVDLAHVASAIAFESLTATVELNTTSNKLKEWVAL